MNDVRGCQVEAFGWAARPKIPFVPRTDARSSALKHPQHNTRLVPLTLLVAAEKNYTITMSTGGDDGGWGALFDKAADIGSGTQNDDNPPPQIESSSSSRQSSHKNKKRKRQKKSRDENGKADSEFVDMLNESQWHLRMKPAQIVREAVLEYLRRHLPKDAKSKILKDKK